MLADEDFTVTRAENGDRIVGPFTAEQIYEATQSLGLTAAAAGLRYAKVSTPASR